MNKYKKYMKEKRTFRAGDCVKWTYKHYLNANSSTLITKRGKFIRKIHSVVGEMYNRHGVNEFCLVHFEGNKNPSRIRIEEIEKC